MVDFIKIAEKWQSRWEEYKVFQVEVKDYKKKKYFITTPYPYMSGLLHLGHLFTYNAPEITARFKMMQGFNVLFKFGFHCTGTPIIAAAQRVKEKEATQIESLKKMGIEDKNISKFSQPEYWVEYFPKETLKDIKNMGYAIDERYSFITTSINPPYNAMISWQFNKLKEKGYIKKGRHPVIWCPKDNVPVGDHDRSEGEGETPQEYLLFKHKLDDGRFVISSTLRPDTVLGITNLFVNPDIEYNEIKIGNENWIIGEKAAERLNNQGYDVKFVQKVMGSTLIGKKTLEFSGKKVPIFPATFLDSDFGTGLVHSVPSDSADDLIALWDLQKDEVTINKFKLNIDEVKKVRPIPILDTPEYGDIAAETMLKKYKITSQNQREKLEEIKKELYKISHYTAKFNELYKHAFSVNLVGKRVEEGKEIIKKELIEKGYAVIFYEPSGKVVCRCLTECTINIVSDQWFIEYNDPKWKKDAHKCLDKMTISPDQVRKQFEYVIDWLHRWACTREYGLGTKLPWDAKWVIESLSDSTLQMAYCTISKYLEHPKIYGFDVNKLNDLFFDYIFLGKGSIDSVQKSTGIPKKMIEIMKKDFEYWYPFDFRNSAKDLIQNHLAFCIFNHTALFPEKHWPKSFIINGRIMVNNEKMSKSKGNFFTMRELYKIHGPDIVRLTAANAGEGMDDANYDMAFFDTSKKRLEEFYQFIEENYGKGRENILSIDKWFESIINETIKTTTDSLEKMLSKSALQYCFTDMLRNLKWYLRRTNNNPNKKLLALFIETNIKLLTPFTPHFCEECWGLIGKKEFVSKSEWPMADEKTIKPHLNYGEELIKNIMVDIREVVKLAKIDNPSSIKLIVSAAWKYTFFDEIKDLIDKTQNTGDILKEVMNNKKFMKNREEISKFLPKMIANRKTPQIFLSHKEEFTILKEALSFIKSDIKCSVEVIEAEKSNEQKARQAMPFKPAIIIS